MKLAPLAVALMLILPDILACGCGIALGPPEVFNNLKEPNTVLLVDINEDGSYHMKPFFRFISLDQPQNVTLVFPMKALPKSFKAEKTTLSEFTDREDLRSFNAAKLRQSLEGAAGKLREDSRYFAPFAAIGVVGTIALGVLLFLPFVVLRGSVLGSANQMLAGSRDTGIISHYEFEGGSLDIFDASSNSTMDEIASRLGYSYDGKLAALIEKYRNNFVSVLNIAVETPLPPERMAYFKNQCPYWHNMAKQALKEKKIDFASLGLSGYYPQYSYSYGANSYGQGRNDASNTNDCKSLAYTFITRAAGQGSSYSYYGSGSEPKGIMLDIGFEADDPIFYPVSVVESYNYPVAQQQYLVRVGKDKEFRFTSSQASSTALVGGMRWYEITSTAADLEGTVGPAGSKTGFDDSLLRMWQNAYYNSVWLALAAYLALIVIAWEALRRRAPQISLAGLFTGGAVYTAYKLWPKDKNAAIAFIAAAVALAAIVFA
ncbi:MAG: hypothetical protein V1708_01250 [Candidatus Micrarchaeota archaeon]